MAPTVYILCAATCLVCTLLLLRAYRKTLLALLGWSALCFAVLTLSNVTLFIDRIILPTEVDLMPWRNGMTLVALGSLIYGLIFESK